MLWFGWSPHFLFFPSPPVPLSILWWLYQKHQLQLVSPSFSYSQFFPFYFHIIITVIVVLFLFLVSFSPTLADDVSLESECFCRSHQYCRLGDLDFSSGFQFFQSPFQTFGDLPKCNNYTWHHNHTHAPQFSGKVLVFISFFVLFDFRSVICRVGKVHFIAGSLFC